MIIADIVFRSLLGKGEKIHYVAHSHPFTIYPDLFKIMFFGILIPLGFNFLLPPFLYLWLVWGGIGALLFLYRWSVWYQDVWLITNHGIIDHEWKSFFTKTTTRIEYDFIEGVSNEINGFWGTILNFGHIKIEHMSGSVITLKNISSPRKVESKVMNHHQEYHHNQKFQDHKNLKELITKMIRS